MNAGCAAIGTAWASLACGWALCAGTAERPEVRVSLDARDADLREVAGALLQAAGLQGVFDPGLSCRLTLKVHELSWRKAFEATLAACGLGYEEEGTVVRVATRERLRSELAERRRLNESRQASGAGRVTLFHFSYARAREMAPLLKKLLPPHAEVVFDERTNTLVVVD